jgi:segregation and condensation protein A
MTDSNDQPPGPRLPDSPPEAGESSAAGSLLDPGAAAPEGEPGDGTVHHHIAKPPHEPTPHLLPESWKVHLPMFDGPLDLLLHLVRVNQVEITDIPVALICDQFQEYLRLMEELDLDVAGEYVYEAAQLIQLKSKLLLPRPEVKPGEPEEDPREDLVQRLLEYRRLKEAAQALAEVDRVRQGIWTRKAKPWKPLEEEAETLDLGEISLFDLAGAFRTVLQRYDREHPPPVVLAGEHYPVRGQVDRLMAALEAGKPFDLLRDLTERSCRSEAISAFLAVLELARLQLVRIHQTESGDVLLYRTTRQMDSEELEAIPG